jgi:hypothetical protein
MPFYTDPEQFYAVMETLFKRLRGESPNPVEALVASRMVLRFRLSDPPAAITINGRRKPVGITYGNTRVRSDLTADLSADALHRILLGERSLKSALAERELKVRGPVWKTMTMGEILRQMRVHYPQVLRDQGLVD